MVIKKINRREFATLSAKSIALAALSASSIGCRASTEFVNGLNSDESMSWFTPLGNRQEPWLFTKWPGLQGKLPWNSLGNFPTPVIRLENLEKSIGFTGQIWLKRDGLSSPLYGGNKIRKLEFELAEADSHGAKSLISIGGIGSHQCNATATFAAQFGLAHSAAMIPQPVTAHVKENLLYNAAFNTHFVYSESEIEMATKVYLEEERLRKAGLNPYIVYMGTSTPRGSLGYADMMLELKNQMDLDELPAPDSIFAAIGSSGTCAGLLIGRAISDMDDTKIQGVRVVERFMASKSGVQQLADGALGVLRGADPSIPEYDLPNEGFTVNDNFFGGLYGQPTLLGQNAHRLLAESEGITFESTYTDKTLAALIDYTQRPESTGKNILMLESYSATHHGVKLPPPEMLPKELQWVFSEKETTPT